VSQYFVIHPETPQPRLVRQAAEIIRAGGVVVYPTDATYALGCLIGDKDALDRIRRIRSLDESHQLTLVCRDLSEISSYAKVGNAHYRLLKAMTPGPYTFILPATKQVPRRIQQPKRKTIGIRVPDNAILQSLLTELGEPLMNTTLQLPGDEQPLNDPYEVRQRLERLVDLIIDGAFGDLEPTTVVDLSEDVPRVVREGRGDVARLGAA
jgi:tRNA threonylcarbamoyl adenosine modification protein (Sua5/YciO/YrdC/YwlC family)